MLNLPGRGWPGRSIFKSASSGLTLPVAVVLTENDIPGASLVGCKPSELKNDTLKFWLKCRGDNAKGLKTKNAY